MPESPRIAELRRRVDADPASIAFAQLAEEYRRAGNFHAAEEVCRAGLIRHPGYLSARVTLGRTLVELGQLDQAEQELGLVLNSAPDNLAAIRGMAEIHQRRGNLEAALEWFRRALPLARHDPDLEETISHINKELGQVRPPQTAAGLSFAEATEQLLSAVERMPSVARQGPEPRYGEVSQPPSERQPEPDPPPEPKAEESAIDFDSLLKSLGVSDDSAPPTVEALLTEPEPTAPRPEPVLPELPVETPPDDPFAALEQGLREFDAPAAPVELEAAAAQEPPAPPAPSAPSAPSSKFAPFPESERHVLDELEAWLAAIKR